MVFNMFCQTSVHNLMADATAADPSSAKGAGIAEGQRQQAASCPSERQALPCNVLVGIVIGACAGPAAV